MREHPRDLEMHRLVVTHMQLNAIEVNNQLLEALYRVLC